MSSEKKVVSGENMSLEERGNEAFSISAEEYEKVKILLTENQNKVLRDRFYFCTSREKAIDYEKLYKGEIDIRDAFKFGREDKGVNEDIFDEDAPKTIALHPLMYKKYKYFADVEDEEIERTKKLLGGDVLKDYLWRHKM